MARDTFACCHWSCYWYLVSRGQDAQDGSASHKHNMSVMSRVRGSPGTHVPQDLETCLRVFMVALQQQKQTHVCACVLSRVRLFVAPWTVAHQAPLSMGFSRQEYWSGLPFPSPGDLPDPGIKCVSCIGRLTAGPPGKHFTWDLSMGLSYLLQKNQKKIKRKRALSFLHLPMVTPLSPVPWVPVACLLSTGCSFQLW